MSAWNRIKRGIRGINGWTQATGLALGIVGTFTISPLFVIPAVISACVLGGYAMTPERR